MCAGPIIYERITLLFFQLAPKFIDKPKIKKVGSAVVMECVLQADPLGNISWARNGVPIVADGHLVPNVVSRGYEHTLSLQINNITVNDGGEYAVFAKNMHGESSANIKLNLGQKK